MSIEEINFQIKKLISTGKYIIKYIIITTVFLAYNTEKTFFKYIYFSSNSEAKA